MKIAVIQASSQKDTHLLKSINSITKRELKDIIPKIEVDFMRKVVSRKNVFDYLIKYGQDDKLIKLLQSYR